MDTTTLATTLATAYANRCLQRWNSGGSPVSGRELEELATQANIPIVQRRMRPGPLRQDNMDRRWVEWDKRRNGRWVSCSTDPESGKNLVIGKYPEAELEAYKAAYALKNLPTGSTEETPPTAEFGNYYLWALTKDGSPQLIRCELHKKDQLHKGVTFITCPQEDVPAADAPLQEWLNSVIFVDRLNTENVVATQQQVPAEPVPVNNPPSVASTAAAGSPDRPSSGGNLLMGIGVVVFLAAVAGFAWWRSSNPGQIRM